MEERRSIKLNMLMSIALTVSNYIFPLLTYSYVTRILLAEGTGKVAFVQSIISYFTYIAALGINGYGMRECAKVQDDEDKLSQLATELICINFISTIIAYLALIMVITHVPKFQNYLTLFAAMSPSILLQTLGMEWLYRGLEKYTYITVRSIVFKTVAVALTFCFIKKADDIVWYGVITIFTTTASNLLNFFNARKYVKLKKIKKEYLKRHLKPIFVFFLSSFFITIYSHFDVTMLGFMKGDQVVGIYNAGMKMNTMVLSVSTAITSVLIPRMSIYYANGEQIHFQNLLLKSLRMTLVLMFPLSVFVILNASNVLCFVCGKDFLPAAPTLIILMLCVLALSMTNLFGNQILVPKNMEKRYSQSVFIGLLINLGLDILLIPQFSAAGAAFSTLVTEVFNMFWMGYGCKKELRYLKENISFRKYVLPMLYAVVVEECINTFFTAINLGGSLSDMMQSFFRIVIGAIVFFGIYYMALLIEREPLMEEGKPILMKILRQGAGKSG